VGGALGLDLGGRCPWGFAPFHYGRWVYWGTRWVWVPGSYVRRPVYAPALVGWVGGSGWSVSINAGPPTVGWVPLAPMEPFVPAYVYTPVYYQRVNPWRPPVIRYPAAGAIDYRNRLAPGATWVPAQVVQAQQPVWRAVRPQDDEHRGRIPLVPVPPPSRPVGPPPGQGARPAAGCRPRRAGAMCPSSRSSLCNRSRSRDRASIRPTSVAIPAGAPRTRDSDAGGTQTRNAGAATLRAVGTVRAGPSARVAGDWADAAPPCPSPVPRYQAPSRDDAVEGDGRGGGYPAATRQPQPVRPVPEPRQPEPRPGPCPRAARPPRRPISPCRCGRCRRAERGDPHGGGRRPGPPEDDKRRDSPQR
jgi:hypothetical protein